MINFHFSQINRVIVHTIKQKDREEEHAKVIHDDSLTIIDSNVLELIKKQLVKALGKQSKSFRTTINKIGADSFFNLTKDLKGATDEIFISVSQKIATKLAVATKRSRPNEGVLIVMDGITDEGSGDYFIVVIKAEFQEALKEAIDDKTKKKKLELLEKLFLSKSDRLYKIGAIKETKDPTEIYPNNDFASLLFDDQFSASKKPADYFYDDFLGFSLNKNYKVLTRDFFFGTKEVINASSSPEDEKNKSYDALCTIYKADNRVIIDPKDFGERFLTDKIQSAFETSILSQSRFERPFKKDMSSMGKVLEKKKMKFDGNILIQGPENAFDEFVQVIETESEALAALDSEMFSLVKIKGKPTFNG